jgi:predicted GNAT superfamily acetyltransferase
MTAGVHLRELRTAAELAPIVTFTESIWGVAVAPLDMLVATVAEGALCFGAFDGETLIGAAYGFPTADPTVHHSHFVAVDPQCRQRGVGVLLKQHQRTACLERGWTTMGWTFDPLVLANAHMNLNVLGAVGVEYHEDFYGAMGGIDGSLPSDRVVVRWSLDGSVLRPSPTVTVPVIKVSRSDITESSPAALEARLALRHELAERLKAGWEVVGVDLESGQYSLGWPGKPSAAIPGEPSSATV